MPDRIGLGVAHSILMSPAAVVRSGTAEGAPAVHRAVIEAPAGAKVAHIVSGVYKERERVRTRQW